MNVACVRAVVTGSQIASGITRLYRDASQVDADLKLEKALKAGIEAGKKDFLYMNNLSDFGYYDVKVIEGRVLLVGMVFDKKTQSYLVTKIRENLKVRELLDELKLEERRGTAMMKIDDYFLERNINTKIFLKSKIKSLNYEIVVVDRKAYVIGIAENNEEHELLTKIISTVSGVREVISHVITVNSAKKLKIEYI
ncbi:hypothetical protein FACS1894152_7050 [Bacilli bacterium]|nr:hypothetical protein FACS1894152_7050 [Bacilli bacterium]